MFGTSALDSRITTISIEYILPKDWIYDDPARRWYVDDVRIDSP